MYACLFGHVSLQRKQDIRLAVVSTYRKLSKLVHVLKVNSRGFADDGDDGRSDDDNDGNDDYRGSRGSQDGSEDEDEGSVLVVYLRLGASKISESARRRAAEFSQGLFSELPSAFQLYRHVVMAGANGCDYLQAGKSLNVSQSHIIQAAKDLQAEGSIVTGKKSVRVSNVGVMFASAALATEWASSTHARGASADAEPGTDADHGFADDQLRYAPPYDDLSVWMRNPFLPKVGTGAGGGTDAVAGLPTEVGDGGGGGGGGGGGSSTSDAAGTVSAVLTVNDKVHVRNWRVWSGH